MKRNAWIVGVLAVFAFALATTVRADNVVNADIPVSVTVTNPCVPELVDLSGNLHLIVNITNDSSGGTHFKLGVNAKTSGTGESSGAKYQGNLNLNVSLNANSGGTFNVTVPLNIELIGQGQVPNFLVHALLHVTVDPAGNVTSSVDNFSAECR
jgi:hypothetical protein